MIYSFQTKVKLREHMNFYTFFTAQPLTVHIYYSDKVLFLGDNKV